MLMSLPFIAVYIASMLSEISPNSQKVLRSRPWAQPGDPAASEALSPLPPTAPVMSCFPSYPRARRVLYLKVLCSLSASSPEAARLAQLWLSPGSLSDVPPAHVPNGVKWPPVPLTGLHSTHAPAPKASSAQRARCASKAGLGLSAPLLWGPAWSLPLGSPSRQPAAS